jgi:NAD(P)-dependent dehydrogenase (short-subunit alcohol dehydrogenase family)
MATESAIAELPEELVRSSTEDRRWPSSAPRSITVNALVPAIWTPMYDKTRSEMSPEQLVVHDTVMQAEVPLGAGWAMPIATWSRSWRSSSATTPGS